MATVMDQVMDEIFEDGELPSQSKRDSIADVKAMLTEGCCCMHCILLRYTGHAGHIPIGRTTLAIVAHRPGHAGRHIIPEHGLSTWYWARSRWLDTQAV